jgi:23S rRNA (cytosine1962-C5)-methyltransferase
MGRSKPGGYADWKVSRASVSALRRGHPWILSDDETEDPRRYAAGTIVRVRAPGVPSPGLARIDGPERIAARLWCDETGRKGPFVGDVAQRVAAALARRRGLLELDAAQRPTDAFRLIHGEADGLPGLAVDRLGPLLRVLVTARGALGLAEPVTAALRRTLAARLGAPPPVVMVEHLGGAAGPGARVRWLRAGEPGAAQSRAESARADQQTEDPCAAGADVEAEGRGERAGWIEAAEAGELIVRERGLRFRVDPGLREPDNPRPGVGLYFDQRENRARLARHASRGGRWLNLFAHTGAFSVALLAAGAEQVVSVDLSAAYLSWLEENLALNADHRVDAARHESIRQDGRRYLDELPRGERFDGIVLDPPTAAAAGRRFFSARKDLSPMVAAALRALAPGGWLLLCRNERRAKTSLEEQVREQARGCGVALQNVTDAGPGPDFPRLRGFPEGDSFVGVIAQRA